jgi:hypothetical protein
MLLVAAFKPPLGMHTDYWLHSLPLELAIVYSGYIFCSQFDTLGCNATTYVLHETLNLLTEINSIKNTTLHNTTI